MNTGHLGVVLGGIFVVALTYVLLSKNAAVASVAGGFAGSTKDVGSAFQGH